MVTTKARLSICRECKHFRNLEPGSAREHIWYNHLCLASPLPTRIDPYDGVEKPYSRNDLGSVYFSQDKPYHYCRTINPDGSCEKFEEK